VQRPTRSGGGASAFLCVQEYRVKTAQRLGFQQAAGMYHIDRSERYFMASEPQNRPDPAAPLQRHVGPHDLALG
jgi:hypothetical protein